MRFPAVASPDIQPDPEAEDLWPFLRALVPPEQKSGTRVAQVTALRLTFMGESGNGETDSGFSQLIIRKPKVALLASSGAKLIFSRLLKGNRS